MENKTPKITVKGEDYKLQEQLLSTGELVIQALRYKAKEDNHAPEDHVVVFSRYTEKCAFRIDRKNAIELIAAIQFIVEGFTE